MSAVACLVVINGSGGGGIINLCRWGQDAFVMVIDYLFRVVHATVTDLDDEKFGLWSFSVTKLPNE